MRLALLQFNSVVGAVEANVARAVELVDESAAAGAELLVLPEYWSTGFFPLSRDYGMYSLASTADGHAMRAVRERASRHGVHVVATIFEQDGTDLYYDTAMLVSPDGGIVGKFRKIHPGAERHVPTESGIVTDLGIETIYFRPGTRFPVFRVGEWRVGIMLCYDAFFPESARCLALGGAELIVSPFGAIDTSETSIWKELLLTRAFENIAYVAVCNSVGVASAPDLDLSLGGRSMVISPLAEVLGEASTDREEIVYAEAQRDELLRARRLHFVFRDRRPEAYGAIARATDDLARDV